MHTQKSNQHILHFLYQKCPANISQKKLFFQNFFGDAELLNKFRVEMLMGVRRRKKRWHKNCKKE